jgi:membrane protease YdiL (CAAX protease family)
MDLFDWLLFDEEGRLRIAWRFFLFGFGFAIVLVIGSLAAAVALAILAAAAPREGAVAARDGDQLVAAYFAETVLAFGLIIAPLTLGWVAVCRAWLDRRAVASLGLRRPASPTGSFLGGTALGIAVILLAAVAVWAAGGFNVAAGSWSLSALWLTIALAPLAFMEEVVVRGYLLQNLLDARRTVFGVIFTSLIFWLLHGLNDYAWSQPLISLNLFSAGVLLALAYIASGNLWFPTALHYGWNLCQGPVLGIPVSGMEVPSLLDCQPRADQPAWLTGGRFGLEGSIMVTLVQGGVCAAFLWWIWRKRSITPSP